MAAARRLWPAGWVRAAAARRGLASRGVAGPGPDGREPDPDSDWEPEERELQEVASALRRQRAAIRFQKIRRQMEPRGAPPRTLSREAMEQIRYLHKEFAETWPVPRLAEGFDVSIDVIKRVLKSKFVPTSDQKPKDQKDQKAVNKQLGQQPRISGDNLKPRSVSHLGSWLMPGGEAPSRDQDHSVALKVMKWSVQGAGTPKSQKGRNKGGWKTSVPADAAPRGPRRSTPLVFKAPRHADGDGSPK
ncbi:neugrin isoform X1 [Sorex fumeus]|uniref:neugrin isoform X1 n=1 Tax=Sorex fumeus TaxID=62283 RepID=UPI0024ADE34E|nr:neugrin isoform X1 [Sorex fumeus]